MKVEHALVTGAAHGIGRATATALARRGYTVHCVDLDEPACMDCAVSIRKAGGAAYTYTVDVTDYDALGAVVRTAAELFGDSLRVVVNNAFSYTPGGCTLDRTRTDWDTHLDILFHSYVGTIRHCDAHLQPGSAVVNVSSVRATYSGSGFGPYSVSKAAVSQLTRVLALELGARQIRVNAVAPGVIATRRTLALDAATHRRFAAITPLGRLGTPDDVADAITFLASEEARFITGQVLTVDGGLTLPLQLDSVENVSAGPTGDLE